MQRIISVCFLCLIFFVNENSAQYYLTIENDTIYQLHDSRPFNSYNNSYWFMPNNDIECYELKSGHLPKPCDSEKDAETPKDVLLHFHIDQRIIDTPMYEIKLESLMLDLNQLVTPHYHPYRYVFKVDSDMSLPVTKSRIEAAPSTCQPGNDNYKPLTQIDIYVHTLDSDISIQGQHHAISLPTLNIILSRESILYHSQLLAHEIYHQLEPPFCDNRYEFCAGSNRNILYESDFICNYFFDAVQLRKVIDTSFRYNHSNMSSDIIFPIEMACSCIDSQFEYPEFTHAERKIPYKVLDIPKNKSFINKEFIENKSNYIEYFINKINKNRLQQTYDLKDTEVDDYLNRKVIGTKSLIHSNIVLLLRDGLRAKDKDFEKKYKNVTDMKKLYEAYYSYK